MGELPDYLWSYCRYLSMGELEGNIREVLL